MTDFYNPEEKKDTGVEVTKTTPTDSRRVLRAKSKSVLKDLRRMKKRQEQANKYYAELIQLPVDELRGLDKKSFTGTKLLVWASILDKKDGEVFSYDGKTGTRKWFLEEHGIVVPEDSHINYSIEDKTPPPTQ